MNPRAAILSSLLLPLALAACGPVEPPGERIASSKQRLAPTAPTEDVKALVQGNTDFSGDLYRQLREKDENLLFSPHSISLALAMTHAGAKGDTEAQMAKALRFDLPQAKLHPAFNSLDQALASRGQGAKGKDGKPFRLTVVNQLFGQKGYSFLPDYLDTVAENYGAGLRGLDFVKSPEPSRKAINDWAEARTEGLIRDLLPQGSIDDSTRLVLANAVYFNAAWKQPFKKEDTHSADFHLLDGSTRSVATMKHGELSAQVADGADHVAVQLPYDGDEIAMLIVMPKDGSFAAVEGRLSSTFIDDVAKSLRAQALELTLPKFTVRSSRKLKEPLTKLGMVKPFEDADFSGIDGTKGLVIGDVYHQAVAIVDEAGTEAAAATAVVMNRTSVVETRKLHIDRPFLFAIRDLQTGAVLFAGRVVAP